MAYFDAASLAYGIDLMGEYAVITPFALTLSAGYLEWIKFDFFGPKSGLSGNWGLILVLAGAKF